MSWTLVGETAFNIQDNDTNQDVSLPGSPVEDDIVIYAQCSDAAVSPGVQTSGYTDLLTDHAATSPGHESGYKIMGATPDTIITFNQVSAGEYNTGVLQVWRGLDTSTPIDATPTNASDSSGMPDPPSYTTVTNNALVIAIGMIDDINVASAVTAPSGYSNLLANDNTANGDNATSMIASKELATAGAENPAAFGGGGSDAWVAVTFALRPAAGFTLTAEQGSFTLTGQNAALILARKLIAEQGSFTLTGQDANLDYSPSSGFTLTAETGTFTLTGQDTTLRAARNLTAEQGSFTLTGQDAALILARKLIAEQGSFTLTGQDANLDYSGQLPIILSADVVIKLLATADINIRIIASDDAAIRTTASDDVEI